MGGNAFPDSNLVRIQREDILPTLVFVSNHLEDLGLNLSYLQDNLMGSVGKQQSSGDIDIALDKTRFSKKTLSTIGEQVRFILGQRYANTKGLRGGQIQTAWPIAGDFQNNLIQIDFILGNVEWLKFSHWSPGLDRSPYKGVWISTLLGVLAKIHKQFELWEPSAESIPYDERDPLQRIARVGWTYDLEQGLNRRWKLKKQAGQGMSEVNPDYWETHLPVTPPRFTRTGFIDNPEDVVRILLGDEIFPKDIETFEDLWRIVMKQSTLGVLPPIEQIKTRFAEALVRSSSGKDFKSIEDILSKDIFANNKLCY
jgi:hypothetical protein